MKKYTIIGTALLAVVLIAGSCKKDLEAEPFNLVSEDVVWSTKANAETFIYNTYGIMDDYNGGRPRTDSRTTNVLAFDGDYNSGAAVFRETVTNTSDYGFNNWGNVRRCNLIIEKVGASAGISAEDKKTLIAEAKFLRAMSYYSIVRNIGRMVWIDKVLTPEDELKLPSTANPTESYTYIIKDLEDAIVDLPITKVSGRVNKYVAAGFLTEVTLQALAYKNYPQAANVSTNDPLLQKIIDNAQLVINGGYSLEPDYGGMFNETKKTSPEIIFGVYRLAINTTNDGTPMQTMVPNLNNDRITQNLGSPFLTNANVFEAWGAQFPSQNFADDYLTIDKANPLVALPWNKTSQYLAAVDEGATVPSTGTQHSVIPRATGEVVLKTGKIKVGSNETIWSLNNENRDARWRATVWSDSTDRIYGELLTMTIRGNANRWMKINGYAYYASLSNMYWRKGLYTNVNPRPYVGVATDYHYVPMRLGRVYLNLAEAYLLKGDVANAVTNLNKTRVIHGKLPAAQTSSLANAWIDYKRERRVDLVLENDYYYSLLRWGRYGGDANSGITPGGTIPELTEVPTVMDVSKDRKSFVLVKGGFGGANDDRQFRSDRRYLMPVAQGWIDQNVKFWTSKILGGRTDIGNRFKLKYKTDEKS